MIAHAIGRHTALALIVLASFLAGPAAMDAAFADDPAAGRIEQRLAELGITLPPPPPAVATYVPYRVAGNLVYIAGQGPADFKGCQGKLGRDLTVAQGYECARRTGLVILAQLKAASGGDLDRVVQAVKISGFVNATPDFTDHPKVINGASDLFRVVFGDAGLAARYAVGAGSLPFNVAVEIAAVFEIRP